MKRRRLALVATIVVLICASGLRFTLLLFNSLVSARYSSALSSYSKNLEPGMTRSDVEHYLGAKAIPYEKSAEVDLVEIGQKAAPWFCSEVNVYVAFDFEAVPRLRDTRAIDNIRRHTPSSAPTWIR